ncbi:MAG: InlB B-repeat-containing protein [Bacillus subtilis]|nr:InlB B-repeat-containing protein [Bacillus subtilis]
MRSGRSTPTRSSFNSNGGSAVTSITQNYGSLITTPIDPTKASFIFGGWYSDIGLSTPYSFTFMPSINITLYAKWNVNSYTISFNTNGGSAVSSITQDAGTVVTEPAEPTKTGYTFDGWYSDAGLTSAYTLTTMPSNNLTLYSKWIINRLYDFVRHERRQRRRFNLAELRNRGHPTGGSDEDGLSVRRLVQRRRTHFDLYVLDDGCAEHHPLWKMECQQSHGYFHQ